MCEMIEAWIDGDAIGPESIELIVDEHDYTDENGEIDEQRRKAAVDAVNNAIYPSTRLADLHAAAARYANW